VITVLSGGVGAARLLKALSQTIAPSELVAIVNVGDDLVLHGLTICPDLDTITYTLAGLNNEELGWGLTGETWRVMKELGELGGESWFGLGDRDLATHLYRSQRLSDGASKSEVADELRRHHGVEVSLLPATNDYLATSVETEIGRLSFQEYFVKHHHSVVVNNVVIEGSSSATPGPGVLAALENASRIVIAPSNPLISIEPILCIPGIREILERRQSDVVAVSPIINGAALKGPADRLLSELGHDVSATGVVDFYRGLVGTWIIDEQDSALQDEIAARGVEVRVTTTIMSDPENAARLAQAVLS
jgi:LPPG:FO 2-phospho-L-lactate transferase